MGHQEKLTPKTQTPICRQTKLYRISTIRLCMILRSMEFAFYQIQNEISENVKKGIIRPFKKDRLILHILYNFVWLLYYTPFFSKFQENLPNFSYQCKKGIQIILDLYAPALRFHIP